MRAIVKCIFLIAVLALAIVIPSARVSAAPNPQTKSGVDRLYVIDCADGIGQDESRWTPGVNVGKPVDFPDHCYLIHHSQGWFLWDTGIDDAVAQLPNHEEVFHEWGPGTGPIWRKPITLAAQLKEIHVKPSGIRPAPIFFVSLTSAPFTRKALAYSGWPSVETLPDADS